MKGEIVAADSAVESDELAYTCPCGKTHQAGFWAAAHWGETLVHQCDACGRRNTIRGGKVKRSSKPKISKEQEDASL